MSKDRGRGHKSKQQSKTAEVAVVDARGRVRGLALPSRQWGWEWREQGQQLLIVPSAQANWGKTSTLWRSVLLRRQQTSLKVVSVGLPKFWGVDENLERARTFEAEVAAGGAACATAKADGQLLVRAVSGERVLWRTRTNFAVDEALQSPLRVLLAANPLLEDPLWAADLSLQFELCLARQRIVIAHERDRLVLVGASAHTDLQPRPWEEVVELATTCGCEVATSLLLTGATISEWRDEVEEWARSGRVDEGVVIRDEDGYPRLRIKSRAYEQAFRLRFEYPPAAIYRSYEKEHARKSESEVVAAVLQSLAVASADTARVRESINVFADAEARTRARLQELAGVVDTARENSSRAEFARSANTYGVPEGPILLKIWDGDAEGAFTALRAHAINRVCEQLSEATVIAAVGS